MLCNMDQLKFSFVLAYIFFPPSSLLFAIGLVYVPRMYHEGGQWQEKHIPINFFLIWELIDRKKESKTVYLDR